MTNQNSYQNTDYLINNLMAMTYLRIKKINKKYLNK